MGIAADVPLVPSGRHAVPLRDVAVQVLADHRGVIAGVLQPGGHGRFLEPELAELLEPAPRLLVADDVRVVRVLPAQDRGARRAAERIGDEEVGEGRAALLEQRLGLRHELVHRDVLVVGQDQHDAGLARYDGGRAGRARILAQPDDEGGEHHGSKPRTRAETMASGAPLRATQPRSTAAERGSSATFWLVEDRGTLALASPARM